VIRNTAATRVAGIFSNPADNSVLTAGSNIYQVSYEGGPEPSTWLATALALGGIACTQRRHLRMLVRFAVEWLLYIWDLHDTALCLLVLGILHDRHVQFVLIFAERDVGRSIAGGNFEDVEKLAFGR